MNIRYAKIFFDIGNIITDITYLKFHYKIEYYFKVQTLSFYRDINMELE